MFCWRFDIQRDLLTYLDGDLDARRVAKIEAHLLDCGRCRARVVRLRDGLHFAQSLPVLSPERDPWDAIEAAISAAPAHATPRPAPRRVSKWKPALAFAGWGLALALVAAYAFVAGERHVDLGETDRFEASETFNPSEFQAVRIADMKDNTQPHVVAEGRVAEVRVNPEDGDMMFKLVDDLHGDSPFVVCEVIDPLRLDPPPVGSRVRVYGVSRYDNKADHEWYEIHPVLGIEVVGHK